MANEISQDGIANIALQDVESSTINITQQLGNSIQYQELISQLKTLQDYLSYIPESETEKRLSVGNQINELESFIEQFRKDVSALAETFNRIEINSERLEIARNFFNEGKFDESREYLQSKIEEIKAEQSELLKKRESYEQEILPKLEHSSMEFLLLALSTASDYKNPNNFVEACEYFELSIKSFEAQFNTFPYAQFLAHHNDYQKAKIYWEKSLEYVQSEHLSSEKAELLNNIAIAFSHEGDFENAKQYYEKALLIGRQIDYQKQDEESKSFIAYILNNLGNLLTMVSELYEAEEKLIEAWEIRKRLVREDSIESKDNVAVTLLNLGVAYLNKSENEKSENCLIESLKMFEDLINERPFYALQQIALIRNNLGDLYWKSGRIDDAEKNFKEAVELSTPLVNANSYIAAPNAILALSNLALFYQQQIVNKEESIDLAFNAILLGLPIVGLMNNVDIEFNKARRILWNWGISEDQIEKWVDEAYKELSK